MRKVYSEIVINAHPAAVWRVITDVEAYPAWNDFTPRITLRNDTLIPGTEFDLDCRMSGNKLLRDEHEVVLTFDPAAFTFCMGTSRSRGRPGIVSCRRQVCEGLGDGRTRLVNEEEFSGILAPLVYLLYGRRLQRAFVRYCAALKRRVEASS